MLDLKKKKYDVSTTHNLSCKFYIIQTSLNLICFFKDSNKVSSGSNVVSWFWFCPFQLISKFSTQCNVFK
jgi:hypothetical protein